jgi:triosephosphate isomerase
MRRALIAANWKMFLNRNSGVALAEGLVSAAKNLKDRDVLICPAAPLLGDVSGAVRGSSVLLGGQNMYFEKEGAFTGESSADMLLSVGCTHVLLGHSERRHVFGEGDTPINKKVLFALESGLKPVLCVGELLEERDAGNTEEVVRRQVVEGLKGVAGTAMDLVTIAYEPVWAIGTGKTATPEDADAVQAYIRNTIAQVYSEDVAGNLRILYGGSVKPDNIDGLMAKEHVDGALVGGASLKADSFTKIINYSIS